MSRSLPSNSQYDGDDYLIRPPSCGFDLNLRTFCPVCGGLHHKDWHTETDLCGDCRKHQPRKKIVMHYRNGREAKNGDKIVSLQEVYGADGKPAGTTIAGFGVLHSAVAGNDYCNGGVAIIPNTQACLCDCLHVDDVAAMLAEKGLDKRPAGK